MRAIFAALRRAFSAWPPPWEFRARQFNLKLAVASRRGRIVAESARDAMHGRANHE